jgi:hypothetical protein
MCNSILAIRGDSCKYEELRISGEDVTMKPQTQFTVNFHFGAEHTKFEIPGNTTLTAVKDRGLADLHIVIDPAFDYLLNYEGTLIENETQTLEHLVGEHGSTNVTFHVQKRPKGG